MTQKETIAIGCDHAAYEMKQYVKTHLEKKGFFIEDFGVFSTESVDYPDIIHPLAEAVNRDAFQRAIIICGSGIGVSMVANKYPNVRCALCYEPELAKMSRLHNDANILATGARFISNSKAIKLVDTFLNTPFEGGRHQKRVNKIAISE